MNSDSWLTFLKTGLSKSSSRIVDGIGKIMSRRRLDSIAIEEIEDILIASDMGPVVASRLTNSLANRPIRHDIDPEEVRRILANDITEILKPVAVELKIKEQNRPHVVLVIGVNGSGKTTTIGKLAHQMVLDRKTVILAAGDTFRAAAIQQLREWGKRSGCHVISGEPGADPSGLVYQAMERTRLTDTDVLIIDTAGRLHNKSNLMAELEKLQRVVKKLDPEAPHETLLVLDATTGQNAISQVESFLQIISITGLIITKLDGTAKGGVLVAIAARFGLPVRAIGVGEEIVNLQPFSAHEFASNLMGLKTSN